MDFATNSEYQAHTFGSVTLYSPIDKTKYHTNRYIAAGCQDIYSRNGIDKEVLTALMERQLEICNTDKPIKNMRTDLALIAQNLLYRQQHPIDEHCSIRMGALFFFLPDEDPNIVSSIFTEKKLKLAKENADLYAFFLSEGVVFTPSYRDLLDTLTDTEYFSKRTQTLAMLTPQQFQP